MTATLVQPYLFFGGRCEEAIEFYRTALGAKVEFLMRYNESPMPVPPDRIPPGWEKKIMHSTLTIGGTTVMASDGNEGSATFDGFALSLTLANAAEAKLAFDALAEGGKVSMPLDKTFWSPCFGSLTDRFGIDWMVTVAS